MPITTSASIAQAKTTLLGQYLLRPLVANNVLKQFFKMDTDFAGDIGSYKRGATISIPVVVPAVTNIVTATGGAVTYPKQTLTSVSLTLDSIASTACSINLADKALANIDPESAQILSNAEGHGAAIEAKLFLDTFNVASIDLNSIGTVGTACNYKLLRTIWSAFQKAKCPAGVRKILFLDPDKYGELLDDPKVARAQALYSENNNSIISDGFLEKTLGIEIYSTVNLPTSTALTNITGTGTNQVGFAITSDSIAAAVRELDTVGNDMGVQQVVVRNDKVNIATRLTKSYNSAVVGGDVNYHMETLFGTTIYRPTTVFPIFGGVA
jgi:hypothetical protein